jgi:hypothetical protein
MYSEAILTVVLGRESTFLILESVKNRCMAAGKFIFSQLI